MRYDSRETMRPSAERVLRCFTRLQGRFLFVWINKTGGTSVNDALGIKYDNKGTWYNHYTAAELMQCLGRERFEQMFKFCFVRNPWDKVVSEFRFRVFTGQTGLSESSDFKEWVTRAYLECDPEVNDWSRMFMPQTDWISDKDGALIVDFVGRFERLQKDFDIVCARLGIAPIELPWLNASRDDRSYRQYFDAETKAIVDEVFRSDIEAFKYEF